MNAIELLCRFQELTHEYTLTLARAMSKRGISQERTIFILGDSTDLRATRFARVSLREVDAFCLAEEECAPLFIKLCECLAKVLALPPKAMLEASRRLLEESSLALGRVREAERGDIAFDAATGAKQATPPGVRRGS